MRFNVKTWNNQPIGGFADEQNAMARAANYTRSTGSIAVVIDADTGEGWQSRLADGRIEWSDYGQPDID